MSDIKLSKVSDGIGVNKEDGILWCTANAVDSKIKSLEEKVKELEDILATYPNKCVTCRVFVDPEECYGFDGTDIMACSEKCLDACED